MRKEQAQLEAANRDPLTGVYNRNAFEMFLREYMEDTSQSGSGALILFDLDDFKSVNDHLVHLEGDRALQYFTKTLCSSFRQQDLVGRMGGDEFLIFLKGMTNREILDGRLEKLSGQLAQYPKISLSCSAGILFLQRENFSYQENLLCVDQLLYHSKQQGKGRHSYDD